MLGDVGLAAADLRQDLGDGQLPRLGSRAFPRTSAVIFTVLSAEALAGLRATLRRFCEDCGERLKMIAWDVEEIEVSP